MPKYRVTVTRGTTESVVVVVEADNADQAEDLALADAGPDLEWTVDAGAYDDPYIGSPGDAELLEEGSRTMTQQSKPVNLDNATFVVHGEQLIAAVESAVLKSAMWQAAGVTRDNGDMWHFAKVECMLIPGAWEHMGRRMQRDGNSGSFAYYQKPARAEDERGLPGYTMAATTAISRTRCCGARRRIRWCCRSPTTPTAMPITGRKTRPLSTPGSATDSHNL
jgi:hypothetical protein